MCGLAGFIKPGGFNNLDSELVIETMCSSIIHRGPDSFGLWIDQNVGIALGHRRLSILELSDAGKQPMISFSGRYIIVFNGEIYNHNHIRARVEGSGFKNWRGNSDTETLLESIELFGLEETLKLSVGMFAFALWDNNKRILSLARDRFGEKPLYYGWQQDTFLFGSELKALKCHPSHLTTLNHAVFPLYLRNGYIPAPLSIWSGIFKLLPGTYVSLSLNELRGKVTPISYWSVSKTVSDGLRNPFIGNDVEAIDELERLLIRSINSQKVADVPVGAFLSGGIDSSTIVAIMQANTACKVNTFTIGFNESDYNEAIYAKEIANYLGTNHHELYVNDKQVKAVISYLPDIYDEPFGDSSAIPTFLLSKLTKEFVTVSLSGDGGDELFGGYDRYSKATVLRQYIDNVPKMFKPLLGAVLNSSMVNSLDLIGSLFNSNGGFSSTIPIYSKLNKLGKLLLSNSQLQFYNSFISQWDVERLFNENSLKDNYNLSKEILNLDNPTLFMMAHDSLSYLPDDILVKVDRASMNVSLESRVPLLDHRIYEFSRRLPYTMKVRENETKWVLKQVLNRYIPQNFFNRPKMGFSVPIDIWLRTSLKEWADDLILGDNLNIEGLIGKDFIQKRWNEHKNGIYNWKDSIWIVLMWSIWVKNNK